MKKSTSIILATVISFGTLSSDAQTTGRQHKKSKKHIIRENTLLDTSGSSAADTSGSKKHLGGKRKHSTSGTRADTTGKAIR